MSVEIDDVESQAVGTLGLTHSVIIPQKYLVGDEEEALATLCASGTVDVHARAAHSGKSPIHLAAWRGSLATVRGLKEKHARGEILC
jgi:hypothetical protein